MIWEEVLAWVQQKNDENYLGHDDWRLPTIKELYSLNLFGGTRSPVEDRDGQTPHDSSSGSTTTAMERSHRAAGPPTNGCYRTVGYFNFVKNLTIFQVSSTGGVRWPGKGRWQDISPSQ
jgi:hypothetical protein